MHALFWGEKRQREENNDRKKAEESGSIFLGATALSDFASIEAPVIRQEISDLLSDAKDWGTKKWRLKENNPPAFQGSC